MALKQSFSKIAKLEESISLEYHDDLNPKIWEGFKLKTDVRFALLEIAETWHKFALIPDQLVKDIILTGGNANFNYTEKSDLDVHILVDRNALGSDRFLIDEFLQDKKILWSLTHDITVKGYPVELYAQDINTELVAGGEYSLRNNKWLKVPQHGSYDFSEDAQLEEKADYYSSLIDKMIESRMDVSAFEKLKQKLSEMRKSGLEKGGEYSFENLLFKELRNRGYLDKMNQYQRSEKDKALSLA